MKVPTSKKLTAVRLKMAMAGASLIVAASTAQAQPQACFDIFGNSRPIVDELAKLRLESERQVDPSVAKVLYSNFRSKFVEARAAGVDLAELSSRVLFFKNQRRTEIQTEQTRRARLAREEARNTRPLVELPAIATNLRGMAFSLYPGTHDVVFRMSDTEIGVLRIGELKPRLLLDIGAISDPIKNLSLDPSARFIAVRTEAPYQPESTLLFEISSGKLLKTFAHTRVVFSPDGLRMAARTNEKIEIFDLPSLTSLGEISIASRPGTLFYSADSKSLIFGFQHHPETRFARIDATTGRVELEYDPSLFSRASQSPDGQQLVSIASLGSGAKIFDKNQPQAIFELKNTERQITNPKHAFFMDDGSVVVLVHENALTIWSAQDQTRIGILETGPLNHSGVVMSDDRSTIYVISPTRIRAFRINDGNQ